MLGVRQGFLEVYHSEMVLSRESQKHLREDAFHMKTLSQVKNGLKQELAQLRWELTNFKADRWRSPHDELTHIQNDIMSQFSRSDSAARSDSGPPGAFTWRKFCIPDPPPWEGLGGRHRH